MFSRNHTFSIFSTLFSLLWLPQCEVCLPMASWSPVALPDTQTFFHYCSKPSVSKLDLPWKNNVPVVVSQRQICVTVPRTDPRTLPLSEDMWVWLMCSEKQGENSLNIPPIFPVNLKWIVEFAKQSFNDPPLQVKMFDLLPAKHKVTDLRRSKRLWSFSSFLDRKIPWGWNILCQGPQWTPGRKFS